MIRYLPQGRSEQLQLGIKRVSEAAVQGRRPWVDSSLDLAPMEAPKVCTFANLIGTQPTSAALPRAPRARSAPGGVPTYRNAAIIRVIGSI